MNREKEDLLNDIQNFFKEKNNVTIRYTDLLFIYEYLMNDMENMIDNWYELERTVDERKAKNTNRSIKDIYEDRIFQKKYASNIIGYKERLDRIKQKMLEERKNERERREKERAEEKALKQTLNNPAKKPKKEKVIQNPIIKSGEYDNAKHNGYFYKLLKEGKIKNFEDYEKRVNKKVIEIKEIFTNEIVLQSNNRKRIISWFKENGINASHSQLIYWIKTNAIIKKKYIIYFKPKEL